MSDQENAARRRLAAARVTGAAACGLVGALAIHMPQGYFGATDVLTPATRLFALGLALLAAAATVAQVRGWRPATLLSAAVFATNIGLFVPALAADPLISGLVIGWNLVLMSILLFPSQRTLFDPSRDDSRNSTRESRWLKANGAAARHLVAVALFSTVAIAGFDVGHTSPARVLTLVANLVLLALVAPFLVHRVRERSRLASLALLAGLTGALSISRPLVALAAMVICLLLVLFALAARLPLYHDLSDLFLERPAILVLSSFLILIAFGSVLLSFPIAAAPGQEIGPIDALFTATSATCVTGLIVLDTPHDFSLFGQAVILVLIQVGGLNIMVLSTFAAILLGRGLGIKGERALGEVLDLQASRSMYRLIRLIVLITLAVEGIGTVILTVAWLPLSDSLASALWKGLFHSVSAFCNAGFALFSDSLVGFQDRPLVLLTIAALITLGGLGFAVLASAWLRLTGNRRVGLAVQLRLVLLSSSILLAVGWVATLMAEWSHGLAGLDVWDKLCNALFQSVTLRTAGFNSMALDGLNPALILVFIVLMFIGASPGGTGGGIKTTTLAVLVSAIPAVARGRTEVVLLRRRIGLDTVFRCAVIAVVATFAILIGCIALLASQRLGFVELLFESVSAFGTVGLSLGATARLDAFGKTVVTLLMLCGRIGPLTIALLLGSRRGSRFGYPEAKIMVG